MTTTTAYQRFIDDLGPAIVKDDGHRAMARCPAHDDNQASLAITGIEGQVLVFCHAGCETVDVMAALNRTMADLFDDNNPRTNGAFYRYNGGRVVRRTPDKRFWQSGSSHDRSLFHVEKLPKPPATVYIPEGEKDCLAIESIGGIAVCSAMGAGKAHLFDWKPLKDFDVIIIADRDEPGRKHANQVAELVTGIAASVKIVEAKTGNDAADHIAAGHSLDEFVEVQQNTVDGAELLSDVRDTLTKYVVFANERQAVAVTLWIAATHAVPAWQHATRLIITSPQKRCGKSRLMDIVAGLSFSSMLCADATTAAIFRSIGKDDNQIPTLHVDEADALWGTKRNAENNEDLRALFNAGWQRNRPAKRCVGPQQIPTDFNTFAMASFAAIGRLPDTITDRAVNIDLKRRGPGETVARFRIRRDGPKLTALRERLTGWVRDPARLAALTDVEPELPAGVEDRAADAWEPLVAIADAAGGDWSAKARAACRALSASADNADDDLSVLLLADVRRIFADAQMPTGWAGTPFLESRTLVHELRDIEESPWNDEKSDTYLTLSKLAKRLKPFGVKPGHNAAKTARGYTLESLRDAFRRYLRPEPSERPTPVPDQHGHDENEETSKCPVPVQPSENLDGSGHFGRLPDTLAENEESPEDAGQPLESDTWTGTDGGTARNETSAAYVNGMCRDCKDNPHSPGRTRCDTCHRIWQTTASGYDQ